MRPCVLALVGCLTLALTAPSLTAQDVLETASGRTFEGKVLSDDGSSVQIETTGGAVMTLPYEQLTDLSQYRLMRKRTGESAADQLALAEWCVQKTLYREAKRHFQMALDADDAVPEEIDARLAVARTTAADELLARAKGLAAGGREADARQLLGIIVQELPEEAAAQEAGELLSADTAQRKESTLARRSARGATSKPEETVPMRDSGEPFSDATRKLFAPIIESYRKILDDTQSGLVSGGRSGIKDYEKALKEGDKAKKLLEKLRPGGVDDEEVAEAVARVDTRFEEALVEVLVHMSDEYLLRNSYNQAGDVVRQGLAEYPQNASLRQAMDRVTSAASNNDLGGWAFGRPGRPTPGR